MPLRRRMAVATALAVGVAVLAAAVVAYAVVRGELRDQIDGQLRTQATLVQRAEFRLRPEFAGRMRGFEGPPAGFPALPARQGGGADYIQFIPGGAGRAGFADAERGTERVRVLTVPLERGGAIQLARSLESTNDVLARLRWVLLALVVGGIALAAALGRLAARHLVAPVVRVTDAARHIAETEDLGRRIEVTSQDEVGELAHRFNAMLDTLEGSIAAQRQLVADASHELRTPVTALRTNIEVLAEDRLSPDERARVVADVQAQSEELSALVADLIELARGDQPSPVREDVRLDALVAEAVERARRHAPGVRFETVLQPAVVDGVPDRLARAVNNLLDNAARHGRAVVVSCDTAGIRVRDDGGGIAHADLPHIFDRFYRGAGARARPGTGLGLAIVRQVAEQHGGSVSAANVDGGAELTMRLPGQSPSAAGS
jgi:two-component system sensor histidine kinase MprB